MDINLKSEDLIKSFEGRNSRSGLHLIYKPLKNDFFRKPSIKKVLFGHYDASKFHYTSLIPQNERICFIPTTNLFSNYC